MFIARGVMVWFSCVYYGIRTCVSISLHVYVFLCISYRCTYMFVSYFSDLFII